MQCAVHRFCSAAGLGRQSVHSVRAVRPQRTQRGSLCRHLLGLRGRRQDGGADGLVVDPVRYRLHCRGGTGFDRFVWDSRWQAGVIGGRALAACPSYMIMHAALPASLAEITASPLLSPNTIAPPQTAGHTCTMSGNRTAVP